MTPTEFRRLLGEHPDIRLLEPCLHDDRPPFVFDAKPQAWDTFRDELVTNLGVNRTEIRVVGSGRFGFSLKPGHNLKVFSDTSDIDVVVVNAGLFDQLWLSILDAAYPRPPVTEMIGGWLKSRRDELYTGWLTPLEVKLDSTIFGTKAKPVLEFNTRWFNALKIAARHPPRRHEGVNGRLYRTWQHADLYHLHSIAALRRSLTE